MIQGVQECSVPCFRKILKISNQQWPNYNICNSPAASSVNLAFVHYSLFFMDLAS